MAWERLDSTLLFGAGGAASALRHSLERVALATQIQTRQPQINHSPPMAKPPHERLVGSEG